MLIRLKSYILTCLLCYKTQHKLSARERDELLMKRMKERMGQEGDQGERWLPCDVYKCNDWFVWIVNLPDQLCEHQLGRMGNLRSLVCLVMLGTICFESSNRGTRSKSNTGAV